MRASLTLGQGGPRGVDDGNDGDGQDRVERELIRSAIANVAQGVPILVVAAAVVVVLGIEAGRREWAVAFGLLAGVVSAWRLMLPLVPGGARRETRQRQWLEANVLVTGAMWGIGTFAIFPVLTSHDATLYVGVVCGSIGVAVFSMGLAGRAYTWLVCLQTGAFVLVSWPHLRDTWPMALLMAMFGPSMVAGSRSVRRIAARAIARQFELDAANTSLREAKQAADAANLAKSTFLANISHEIRTPLTAIIGFSEDLPGLADADRREDLHAIQRAGRHLLGLVDDLLDLSRVEAGRLDFHAEPVTLRSLISQVVEMVAPRARAKGLALRVDVDERLPAQLHTDPLRLRQVLLNLLGNAVKFTDGGSVSLLVRCEGSEVQLAVEDTGAGIDAATLQTLFTPFSRGESALAARVPGVGLGLALSRRLAEAMGGSVTVSSRPGAGSRFLLRLPMSAGDAASAVPPVTRTAVAPGPIDATVLLVEDNADNRRLMTRFIEAAGARVLSAVDGRGGIALALTCPHALLLMDVQLPDADGLALVRDLRALGHDRPIVVLSADAARDTHRRARLAGADAFLAKPLDRLEFAALLHRLAVEGDRAPGHEVPPARVRSALLDEDPSLIDMVEYFVHRLPGLLAELEASRESAPEDFRRRLHDLKSLGGSYGYPQLSVLADALSAPEAQVPPAADLLLARLRNLAVRIHDDAVAGLAQRAP